MVDTDEIISLKAIFCDAVVVLIQQLLHGCIPSGLADLLAMGLVLWVQLLAEVSLPSEVDGDMAISGHLFVLVQRVASEVQSLVDVAEHHIEILIKPSAVLAGRADAIDQDVAIDMDLVELVWQWLSHRLLQCLRRSPWPSPANPTPRADLSWWHSGNRNALNWIACSR